MDKVWVSDEIFNFEPRDEGGFVLPSHLRKRSYEIWNRARELIEKNESLFDLCDGISNLKRSLNHRLQLIEDTYHLKSIVFSNKPKGYLELLEEYGLVRPYIMKKLLEIRNDIEHNDAAPPDITRCKELVDVMWYFLKSTDSVVEIKKEEVTFILYDEDGSESNYWFSVNLDNELHKSFEISGWFPEEMISYNKCNNFFPVNVNKFNGKDIFEDLHEDKLDTDRWVNGKVEVKFLNNYKELVKCVLTAT